jgi:hypothetical protein
MIVTCGGWELEPKIPSADWDDPRHHRHGPHPIVLPAMERLRRRRGIGIERRKISSADVSITDLIVNLTPHRPSRRWMRPGGGPRSLARTAVPSPSATI